MTLFTDILSILLALVAAVVVLSATFLWYEAVNRDPKLLNERFKPSNLWLAAKLMVGEFVSLCLIIVTFPFGFTNRAEDSGTERNGVPIIFLHGLFHNRAAWMLHKNRLRRRGLNDLYTINLPSWKDVETLTEKVAMLVDELRQKRGIEKVHLVGHSMGGIIARNYLQIRGGAEKIDRCVLLGAPNAGSKLVPFVVTELGKNLMPGSAFLNNLNTQTFPKSARLINIYTRHDNLVIPFESSVLKGQKNVELSGLGHNALLFHPAAFQAIHSALTDDYADN